MHTYPAVETPERTIVIGGREFQNRAGFIEHFEDLYELEDLACTDFTYTRSGGMVFQVVATCSQGSCASCG